MAKFTAIPQIKRLLIEIPDLEKMDGDIANIIDDITDDDGNIIPEKLKQYTITKSYIGYMRGPGTPVPVAIEVDNAYDAYNRNFPSEQEKDTLSPTEYYTRADHASKLLRRDMLTATIANMDIDTANVLAGSDEGPRILIMLGWFSELKSDEEEDASSTKGEDVTGVSTSPTLLEPSQENNS